MPRPKQPQEKVKMKLKKGDVVRVMTGKNRGAEGKIVEVDSKRNRVTVENVNVVKRTLRPTQKNPKGGFSEREASIHASNLRLLDPTTGEPTRIGYRRLENGQKVRVSKRSGAVIDAERGEG